MHTKNKYPNQLLRYRRIAGLSYKQVARILGVRNENIISRWERGLIMQSGPNIFRMAILYGASLAELYPEYYQRTLTLVALRREKFSPKHSPPIDRSQER